VFSLVAEDAAVELELSEDGAARLDGPVADAMELEAAVVEAAVFDVLAGSDSEDVPDETAALAIEPVSATDWLAAVKGVEGKVVDAWTLF
jgi:hypothetical protein